MARMTKPEAASTRDGCYFAAQKRLAVRKSTGCIKKNILRDLFVP